MMALENISKSFADNLILNHISLELPAKGISCLLGKSGCGKSTLLRIAAGLSRPDSGRILIPRQKCAMVFQDSRLLPWLSVKQNLSLAIPRPKRHKTEALLKEALNAASLQAEAINDLFPRELSGGMAQRVGIARALLREPEYLLMDEPFASLDAMTRKDLQLMLMDLIKNKAINCIFVTHDMEEAFNIADRILILQNGSIELSLERDSFDSWLKRESARVAIVNLLAEKRSY